MKTVILSITVMLALAGCNEAFMGGATAGAVAMRIVAEQEKSQLQDAVDVMQAERAEVETLIEQVQSSELKAAMRKLSSPSTPDQLEQLLSTKWTDNKVWPGYLLTMGMSLIAGYQKYQRTKK
jgi:hypothetical protein